MNHRVSSKKKKESKNGEGELMPGIKNQPNSYILLCMLSVLPSPPCTCSWLPFLVLVIATREFCFSKTTFPCLHKNLELWFSEGHVMPNLYKGIKTAETKTTLSA